MELSEESKSVISFVMVQLGRRSKRGQPAIAIVRSHGIGHVWIVGVPGEHRSALVTKRPLMELMQSGMIKVDRKFGVYPQVDKIDEYFRKEKERAEQP